MWERNKEWKRKWEEHVYMSVALVTDVMFHCPCSGYINFYIIKNVFLEITQSKLLNLSWRALNINSFNNATLG